MLIVSNTLSDRANDKQELLPVIDAAKANGFKVDKLLADTGYYSENNVTESAARGVEAYIAVEKQGHGIHLETILGGTPAEALPLPAEATTKERMAHKLKKPAGSNLYKLRKQTVEPVFGIIKHCMGFRQFLMRGKENVTSEWNLVCTAYNLKRIFNLKQSHTEGSPCPNPLQKRKKYATVAQPYCLTAKNCANKASMGKFANSFNKITSSLCRNLNFLKFAYVQVRI